MGTKSFLGAVAIVSVAGLAFSQASTSQAGSLNDAVTVGGMGARIDGFRAFVLPGVVPVALLDSDSYRGVYDSRQVASTNADETHLDDALDAPGWETSGDD